MKFLRKIDCIDTHTCGEPTRIVIIDELNFDPEPLRKILMREPRGHSSMFGAFLTKSTNPECLYNVTFCDNEGYLPMCGHGCIGIASALVKLGRVPLTVPSTRIQLNSPVGEVSLWVQTPDSTHIGDVTLEGIPSFVYAANLTIPLENSQVKLDIAFGGNFAAIVDVRQFNLSIEPKYLNKLVPLADSIKDEINKQIKVTHPLNSSIKAIEIVLLIENDLEKEKNAKSLAIFDNGQIDRSPCGTGTSARMALLIQQSLLKPEEIITTKSITGEHFSSWAKKADRVGSFQTYIPYIKAPAYITSFSQFVVEENDPFKEGFIIKSLL